MSHRLYFGDDGSQLRGADTDEEEGWRDEEKAEEGGQEDEDEDEYHGWANGSGHFIPVARQRWRAHSEGAPHHEFVRITLVVEAFAVGYRPCRACGRLGAELIW